MSETKMLQPAPNLTRLDEAKTQIQDAENINDNKNHRRLECAVCGCQVEGRCDSLSYHYLTHSLLDLALALATLQVKLLSKRVELMKQQVDVMEEEEEEVEEGMMRDDQDLITRMGKEETNSRDGLKATKMSSTFKGVRGPGCLSRTPAKCPVCAKTLSSRSGLTKHMVQHSADKPYKCDACAVGFNQQRDLRAHQMQRHSNLRPHQCRICGKGFVHRFYLAEHMSYHTGDKEHQCSDCGRRFQALSALTKHMKRHTTVRPYACNICGKAFAVKMDMKAHVKLVHERQRPADLGATRVNSSSNSSKNSTKNSSIGRSPKKMEETSTSFSDDKSSVTSPVAERAVGTCEPPQSLAIETAVAAPVTCSSASADSIDDKQRKITVDDEIPPPVNISIPSVSSP